MITPRTTLLAFLAATATWLFLSGCHSTQQALPHPSPLALMPPLPGQAPRQLIFMNASQPLVVVYHRGVSWDYNEPMPASDVAFDVEGSTNLVDWYLIQTTNQPPAYWASLNPVEFVRVGAHWTR